jgi:hypothetical protein
MAAAKNLVKIEPESQKPNRRLKPVDDQEKHKTKRRVWRQILKFVMACMQVKRNDLHFESWHRLEYRNEYQAYDKYHEQLDYRFM